MFRETVVLLVVYGVLVVVNSSKEHPCPVDVGICPPLWQTWNESCLALTKEQYQWSDARERCRSMGGEMMAPRSKQENDIVLSMITESGDGGPWIDCNYQGTEEQWVCGGDTASFYTNWGDDEPDKYTATQCARIKITGEWSDRPCSLRFSAVCKRDPLKSGVHFQLRSWRLLNACLIGHVMNEPPTNSIRACGVECSKTPDCHSFNVLHQGKVKTCQLNNARRSDVNQDKFIKKTSPLCIYGEQ